MEVIQFLGFVELYNIRMFRKNGIERSHSAGTKIVNTKKIPSDFFTPNQPPRKKDNPSLTLLKPRELKSVEKTK